MKPLLDRVVIHCNPTVLNIEPLKEGQLSWKYSEQFGTDEVDIYVVDRQSLEDEELCEVNGIDYNNHVNCVELISRS